MRRRASACLVSGLQYAKVQSKRGKQAFRGADFEDGKAEQQEIMLEVFVQGVSSLVYRLHPFLVDQDLFASFAALAKSIITCSYSHCVGL